MGDRRTVTRNVVSLGENVYDCEENFVMENFYEVGKDLMDGWGGGRDKMKCGKTYEKKRNICNVGKIM